MREYQPTPEPDFNVQPVDSAVPLISQGLTRYRNGSNQLLEQHTGNKEVFLTTEQEQSLAAARMDGEIASEILTAIGESTTALPDVETVKDLTRRVNAGHGARNTLVECNLRFARHLARASMNILAPPPENGSNNKRTSRERFGAFGDITKLKSPYASLEDRIQIANLGLIEAANKFKPKVSPAGKPYRFTTSAIWYIHDALYRAVMTSEHPGPILPNNVIDELTQARNDPDRFGADRLTELGGISGMRDTVSLETLNTGTYASEEAEETDDLLEPLTAAELIPDLNQEDSSELASRQLLAVTLQGLLDSLDEREAKVISERFGLHDGLPKTLDEIGQMLGVTRERVRQLEGKTMSKLRHPHRSTRLRDLLDNFNDANAENNLLGSLSTAPSPWMGGLLQLSGATIDTVIESTRHARASASQGTGLDPRDEWDIPLRRRPEEMDELYEQAGRKFENILRNADITNFLKPVSADTPNGLYPVELLAAINQECGSFLRPYHIEEFWNNQIERYAAQLQVVGGELLDIDRLSLLFSHLLSERMTDQDSVTLNIPANLQGKLNMFGANLRHGVLTVNGDLGDFAAYRSGSLANLTVNGNVGDYAASEVSGLASITISGNAGREFAYGTVDGTLTVKGIVKSLSLRPGFKGDVFVGRAEVISLAAPAERITFTNEKT